MVRAIYKDGAIWPVEPLPEDWREGQELIVDAEENRVPADPDAIAQWNRDVDDAAAEIPTAEFERLFEAIEAHRREAKQLYRL